MILYVIAIVLGFIVTDRIQAIDLKEDPELFNKCFNDDNLHFLQQRLFSDIDPVCVQYFMKTVVSDRNNIGFTEESINYLRSVEREGIALLRYNRRKRQAVDRRIVRKECRVLTESERTNLFDAMRFLKFGTLNNIYDVFAGLHQSFRSFVNAHGGSNFLGWHRVYLYYFERSLRRYRNTALCYWDSTCDFLIPNDGQRNTSAFTDELFGNGNGVVINGPFRNWPIPGRNVSLRRNIAGESSLMRPHVVDRIMNDSNIINHTQITFGFEQNTGFPDPDNPNRRASLEGEHNNPHVWVGEVMADASIAPQDGVFWFHHTFIDYIWEHFRQKMIRLNRDPETDYPGHGGEPHAGDTPMEHFYNISSYWINRNGLTNAFTRYVYRYQDHPTCANNCQDGTNFLYCPSGRSGNDRCVARTVETDAVNSGMLFGGRNLAGDIVGDGIKTVVSRVATTNFAKDVERNEGPLPILRKFASTFDDNRIQ